MRIVSPRTCERQPPAGLATIFSADYTAGPIAPLLQLQQLDVTTPICGQCARSRKDLIALAGRYDIPFPTSPSTTSFPLKGPSDTF